MNRGRGGALPASRVSGILLALFPAWVLLLPACAGGGGGGEADPPADSVDPREETVADQARVAPSPPDWVGCYRIVPGADGWRVPEVVALDSVPLEGWPSLTRRWEDVRQARSFGAEGGASDIPFAYWRPLGDTAVTVAHPGALAGVTLRIRVRDGALSGTLVGFTDVVTPGESGRDSTGVDVTPTSCPGGGSGGA